MVGGRELDEEATSWIRRTKFSHTVCYRFDSSKLASFPIIIQPENNSGLKSRPIDTSLNKQTISSSEKKLSDRTTSQIQLRPVTSKQRSKSPQPRIVLSDTFKEARFERKRFSTPHPRRKDCDEGFIGKLFRKDSQELKQTKAFLYGSPLRYLASVKGNEKPKSKREFACAKYFDNSGGRVNAVEAVDNWTIDMSKLFLGMRFAFGAHSRVYHGMYEDENVAVKIISVPDDDENGVLAVQLENQFSREVTLLSRLHHPNVIKFVAASRKTPIYCIITEYLSEGSLRAYLHKLKHKSLPLQKLIVIALDIARGMEYVHSQGVIHRDLKPENILVDQNFHMKIADFGIACEEAYCDSLADDPGTYRWMAPEMIKRKSYGRKVDVYSFGLILWEMVSGRIPYEDMNPIQAAFAVVNKNLRPDIPESCPPAMQALIEQCWSLQSEKRPEFWQIVKVLEQFESSLAFDGTLSIVQNTTCQDQKRGLLHWFQKIGPINPSIQAIQKLKITQPSS